MVLPRVNALPRMIVVGAHAAWDVFGENASLHIPPGLQVDAPLAAARLFQQTGGFNFFTGIDHILITNHHVDNGGGVAKGFLPFSAFRASQIPAFAEMPLPRFHGSNEDMGQFWNEYGRSFSLVRGHQLRVDIQALRPIVSPWVEGEPVPISPFLNVGLVDAAVWWQKAYKTQDGTIVTAHKRDNTLIERFWEPQNFRNAHFYRIIPPGSKQAYQYRVPDVEFEVGKEYYGANLLNTFEWKGNRPYSEPKEIILRDGNVLKVTAVKTHGHITSGGLGYIFEYPDGRRIGYTGDTQYTRSHLEFLLERTDALFLDMRILSLRKDGRPDNVHGDALDRVFTELFDRHPYFADRIIVIDYDRPDLPLLSQLPFLHARTGDRLHLTDADRRIQIERPYASDDVLSFSHLGTTVKISRQADHTQVSIRDGQISEVLVNPRLEISINGQSHALIVVDPSSTVDAAGSALKVFISGKDAVVDSQILVQDLAALLAGSGASVLEVITSYAGRASQDPALINRQRGIGEPELATKVSLQGDDRPAMKIIRHDLPKGAASIQGLPQHPVVGRMTDAVVRVRLMAELPDFETLTPEEQTQLIRRADLIRDAFGHFDKGSIRPMVEEAYRSGALQTRLRGYEQTPP